MKRYMVDFETSTKTWNDKKTWVWAWGICDIENPEQIIKIDNNIESFMELLPKLSPANIYFQNLKFDIYFIIDYLENNKFEHISNSQKINKNCYKTIISNVGVVYGITIYFQISPKVTVKINIYDSYKIIPLSVAEIPRAFNLPYEKLDLDYNKPRKRKQYINEHEKKYISNDIIIVAMALNKLFNMGLTRMTLSTNALYDYKNTLGIKKFEYFFPKIDDIYEPIKRSYKGGFIYLNPEYEGKDLKDVTSIDCNSLYPYILYNKKLPFGLPQYFEGKYKQNSIYTLYIQNFSCSFNIKPNKLPTIQVKSKLYNFLPSEYILSSHGKIITLSLTNIDFELFLEHYDIDESTLVFHDGWQFKSMDKLFKRYIDKWYNIKVKAQQNGNNAMRTIAKLMLCALYRKVWNNTK